jgi:hypothetical protein
MSAGGPFPVAGEWEESGSGNRRADSSRGPAGAHFEGALATDLHVRHCSRDADDEHTAFFFGNGGRSAPSRPPVAAVYGRSTAVKASLFVPPGYVSA